MYVNVTCRGIGIRSASEGKMIFRTESEVVFEYSALADTFKFYGCRKGMFLKYIAPNS